MTHNIRKFDHVSYEKTIRALFNASHSFIKHDNGLIDQYISASLHIVFAHNDDMREICYDMLCLYGDFDASDQLIVNGILNNQSIYDIIYKQ